MFIRAIVVPILVICLILFVGVSFNNADFDTNNDMMNNQTTNDGTMNGTDITTTPILNGENDGINNGIFDNMGMDMNNTKDSFGVFTTTETQIKNELERINGLGTVYVEILGDTVYVVKNGENTLNQAMSTGDVTIRDEIIRTVKTLNTNIRRICVLDNSDIYGNYTNNMNTKNFNSIDLSKYINTQNVIELY